MKKILFMFLMVFATMFASPLFALDESPPEVQVFDSINAGDVTYVKNGYSQEWIVKLDITHKDTLMYSWGETGDNRISEIDGYSTDGADMDKATLAVVCQPDGDSGV